MSTLTPALIRRLEACGFEMGERNTVEVLVEHYEATAEVSHLAGSVALESAADFTHPTSEEPLFRALNAAREAGLPTMKEAAQLWDASEEMSGAARMRLLLAKAVYHSAVGDDASARNCLRLLAARSLHYAGGPASPSKDIGQIRLSGVDGTGDLCELTFHYQKGRACWNAYSVKWDYRLELQHHPGKRAWRFEAASEHEALTGWAITMEDAARRAMREMGP